MAAHIVLVSCAARSAPREVGPAQVSSRPEPPAAAAALAALFAGYWDGQARLFPLKATQEGDQRYNDRLPNDQTELFRDKLRNFYREHQTALGRIERSTLRSDEQTSYDIFAYDLEMNLAALDLNIWMMPFTQISGLPNDLGQEGTGHGAQPFSSVQDYRNWLDRVRALPAWADSAIDNFRSGIRAGVVLPRAVVEKMIPQLESFVTEDPTTSLFYGPIKEFPANVAKSERPALAAAYRQAVLQDLVPSYRKLADFLRSEYLPHAQVRSGLDALPGGREMYAFKVRQATTTDKTPAEIHEIGLREVERIRVEMERVRRRVGYSGSLDAFLAHMRTDPKFRPFKSADDVLEVYRGVLSRITPRLPGLFGQMPRAGFEIRQTEAFRAASASAQYVRAAPDGSRPGIFYVPITDPTQYNVTRGMDALFLHEAIPGHHYQLSLQQENTSLPEFRRFGTHTAFVEGWGLYAESLGEELGVYTDPYQQMGALVTEMLRAVRLVVDTGLHSRDMSREAAIKYMMDNLPIDEQRSIAEVERYMALPGQALSYKMGSLKLQELRARYERQLGGQFSLRAFHDELLAAGAMPLVVLERHMDAWAAQRK